MMRYGFFICKFDFSNYLWVSILKDLKNIVSLELSISVLKCHYISSVKD